MSYHRSSSASRLLYFRAKLAMAHVITIANQKGGVGKTTTVSNLGVYLAAYGKKVLIIDIDPQSNATSTFSPTKDIPIHVYHALVGNVHPDDIIRPTGLFSLDILPAHAELAGATIELVSMENREFKLQEITNKVRHNYDFILIDCPPSLGLLTLNGIVAADYVIVPVQAEYYALEGLGQLLNSIDLVKENLGRDIKILGALCTMYDKRNRLSRNILKDMRRSFPGYVFEVIIPRNVTLAEAPGYGRTIYQHDPASTGANAYRQLAKEVINRLG